MNLVRLSLAYLRLRLATTLLSVALLALGVCTIVVLVLLGHQLRSRIEAEIRGIDLVVGAKGSPLQLLLSAVFQVDVPTGNVPLAEVEKIRRHPLVARSFPIAMGDSALGFRLIGTEPELLADRGGTIVQGRLWEAPMEAVLGSEVARATGLSLGQTFVGSHGLTGGLLHADHPYTVVGIATRTGTALDRVILTSVESVWQVHARPDTAPEGSLRRSVSAEQADQGREITALLVRYRSPLAAVQLPRLVNAQPSLQAAVPAFEATRLLALLGVGLDALRLFGVLLMGASALSVLVALTNALTDRRADLALMRVLGATRWLLVRALVLEALLLTCVGLVTGMAMGHGSVELVGRLLPEADAAGLTGRILAPGELWLIPAAFGLALLATALPAVRAYRSDLVGTLSRG